MSLMLWGQPEPERGVVACRLLVPGRVCRCGLDRAATLCLGLVGRCRLPEWREREIRRRERERRARRMRWGRR